jgi:hypothetical protein
VSDLARRLGYLVGRSAPAPRRARAASSPCPPGEDWERVGQWTWRRVERVPGGLPGGLRLRALGRDRAAGDLLFYDTETTGLSGGAGSLAFLIGLARARGDEVEMEQLFLSDFPGEPEFLEALAERLAGATRTLVSYNGKGFDAHLLRSRFALVGLEVSFSDQIDLLYPTRRLWRRMLPECSLTAVGQAVLGLAREHDIPGAEVPDAWFEYLRRAEPGRMPLVFEHNRLDLLAMVRLVGRIEGLAAGYLEPEGVDVTSLGAWLLERGEERGIEMLRRGLEAGDAQAGRLLGQYYKRLRDWDRAVEVWERMAAGRSAHAAVELAKYAEHRLRRPERALAWLDSAWDEVVELRRDDAERRRTRLLAKVERSG